MKISIVNFTFCVYCLHSCQTAQLVLVGKPDAQCAPSKTTTFRLPPKASALFSVDTQETSSCALKASVCPQKTWKLVRDLESFLNGHFNYTGDDGVVQFNNNLLIKGFHYLLHVTLKYNGKIDVHAFNLTFFDQVSVANVAALGQLYLDIGVRKVYRTFPLIINARLTFCGEAPLFYFKWSIITGSGEIALNGKSPKMMISVLGEFTGAEPSCTIRCQVLTVDTDKAILEESESFEIIDGPELRNFSLEISLPFKRSTFDKHAPISIMPYIRPENDSYNITWSCIFNNFPMKLCQKQANKKFYIEEGFDEDGNYTINLTVQSGNASSTVTCLIIVSAYSPSIDIDSVYPVYPENGIELKARISGLRTYCTVQWSSQDLLLNEIPGLITTTHNILSKDKTFLEDMIELGNLTVTREFKVNIPAPSRNWPGLTIGRYTIELSASCPDVSELNNVDELKERPEKHRNVSAEIELIVPDFPNLQSLDITYEDSRALKDEFEFVVNVEIRRNDSLPRLYRYGFVLNGVDVIFYTGLQIFKAKTILPFNSDKGIETFVQVCDFARGRCSKQFGPLVVPRRDSDLLEAKLLKEFSSKLTQEDFYGACSYAFIVVETLGQNNQSEKLAKYFSSHISDRLQMYLRDKNAQRVLENLNGDIAPFIAKLNFSRTLLENMVSKIMEQPYDHYRIIREINPLSLFDFREKESYLRSMQSLIPSLKQDRKTIKLLDKWAIYLCNTEAQFQTTDIVMEKISAKALSQFVVISSEHMIVLVQINVTNLERTKKVCIVYSKIMNGVFGSNNALFRIGWADPQEAETTILVPKRKGHNNVFQCLVYKNNTYTKCVSMEHYENWLQFSCNSGTGYYFLLGGNESIREYSDRDVLTLPKLRPNIGKKISYVIILSTLVGFLILGYIIRKLTIYPNQNVVFDDSNYYGHVMSDDF